MAHEDTVQLRGAQLLRLVLGLRLKLIREQCDRRQAAALEEAAVVNDACCAGASVSQSRDKQVTFTQNARP